MGLPATLYINYLTGIVAIATGLSRYSQMHVTYRFFFIYVITSLVTDIIGLGLAYKGLNNHIIFDIFHFIELTILSVIILQITPSFRLIVAVFYILTTMVSIYGIMTNKELFLVDIGILVKSVCICIIFYIVILKSIYEQYHKNIFTHPLFWMCISLVIYNACIIPFFSFFKFLTINQPTVASNLFPIIDLLNILRYGLFCVGFLLIKQYKTYL